MSLIKRLRTWLIPVLLVLSFSFASASFGAEKQSPHNIYAHCETKEEAKEAISLIDESREKYYLFMVQQDNSCYDRAMLYSFGFIPVPYVTITNTPILVSTGHKDLDLCIYEIYKFTYNDNQLYTWKIEKDCKPLDNA